MRVVRFEFVLVKLAIFALTTPRLVTFAVAVLLDPTFRVETFELVLVKLAMFPFTTPRVVIFAVAVLLV